MADFTAGLVDVFAEAPLTGNPLAVVEGAEGLSDDVLRRIARERDWPVLVFVKPVALRTQLPASGPTLAAIAVGGVVAIGGVLWAGARARRRAG